jgi:hypothetical protein
VSAELKTPKVGQTASTAAKRPDAAVEDAPPSILTGLDGVTVIRSSDDTGPVAGTIELLIVGERASGKSALLRRLTQDKFDSHYDTTIGADFGTVRVKIDGRTVKLLVWDCAGACCPHVASSRRLLPTSRTSLSRPCRVSTFLCLSLYLNQAVKASAA